MFDKKYANLCKRLGVFVTYLKGEDVFCLYYPAPVMSNGTSLGQQEFKFEYYDMVYAIAKSRGFYRDKDLSFGQSVCLILKDLFGYKMNNCLEFVFNEYCLSKTILDKCTTMKKKNGCKRKVELKRKE